MQRGSVALFVAVALTAPTQIASADEAARLPSLTPVVQDDLSAAYRSGEVSEARYALERAATVFDAGEVAKRFGTVEPASPRLATALLRDLALRRPDLTGQQEARADALLARPTDPSAAEEISYPPNSTAKVVCERVCIHWVEDGSHAPPDADLDGDGLADQVERVLETYARVLAAEVDSLGFQMPPDDSDSSGAGPNGLHDVYLADLGSSGLYGYCASDDPGLEDPARVAGDASTFCVIENDFAEQVFADRSPLENLQITAAHEFFHAVQAGYDYREDVWFMEATATWIEDVVYDDINDNYRYLVKGAIPYPDFPLDHWDASDDVRRYSSWLFIRFLTEYLGAELAPADAAIREMWEIAAHRESHPADPNLYSIQAIESAITARGFDPKVAIANFHMNNWAPQDFYEEGQAYVDFLTAAGIDPLPFVTKTHWFSRSIYTSGRWELPISHLSAVNIGFKPRPGVPAGAQLRIEVNGPGAKRSPMARFVVRYLDGTYDMGYIRLNAKGDGAKLLDFGGDTVERVILTMINASSRMEACGSGTYLSCGGLATDELVPFVWRGTIY